MSLKTGDLTTLGDVQLWLPGLSNPPSGVVEQLITRCSQLIRSYLNRPNLLSTQYSRFFDGTGTGFVVLPDFPVTSVQLVQLGNLSIPQSPAAPALPNGFALTTQIWGWKFPPWAGNPPGEQVNLEFVGGLFNRGRLNFNVQYTAGYLIQNEADTVGGSGADPAYSLQVQQPYGICAVDEGVKYAVSGAPLMAVASDPGFGQYIPPVDTAPGLYQFSSADAGVAVLVSYSFVPGDLEEACIQMVGERYSYRTRIGLVAQGLGGQETMRYFRGALPPEVCEMLNPYRNVLAPAIGGAV